MKRAIVLAALLAAGCSSPSPPAPTSAATPPSSAVAPAATRPVSIAPTPPRSPLPVADSCGASQLQRLIGHPRTDIPVPLHPNLQRVACTTCPLTEDYNPARLNFLFDEASGLIREIRCG